MTRSEDAVDQVQVAVGVEEPDVGGAEPAVGVGAARAVGPVAGEEVGPADRDEPGVAVGRASASSSSAVALDAAAVGVDQPQLDARQRPADRARLGRRRRAGWS